MKRTLRYDAAGYDYELCVVEEYIVRFSKSADGELTYIHLSNGEELATLDSINTLEARLNSED